MKQISFRLGLSSKLTLWTTLRAKEEWKTCVLVSDISLLGPRSHLSNTGDTRLAKFFERIKRRKRQMRVSKLAAEANIVEEVEELREERDQLRRKAEE